MMIDPAIHNSTSPKFNVIVVRSHITNPCIESITTPTPTHDELVTPDTKYGKSNFTFTSDGYTLVAILEPLYQK